MLTSRFAPSPTGQLHLGHAYSAALGHQAARAAAGRFLLRIEDLDPDAQPAGICGGHRRGPALAGPAMGRRAGLQSQRGRSMPQRSIGSRMKASLTPASARAPTSPPVADRAARRRSHLLSRDLPEPARRSRAPGRHAALLAARLANARSSVAGLPRGPKPAAPVQRRCRGHRRRHPRPQGCARQLPSRLCRRRLGEGVYARRARRGPAPVDPGPTAAPDSARPSGAGLSPPPARRSRRRPDGSPSATWRRRWKRCAAGWTDPAWPLRCSKGGCPLAFGWRMPK